MASEKPDLLQGTLDLLILKTIATAPMHGYAIAQRILVTSRETLEVQQGSLYPALHRMEQEGWIRADWGKTEKKRDARFYSLTAKGRKQLMQEEESWARLTEGVERVIRFA